MNNSGQTPNTRADLVTDKPAVEGSSVAETYTRKIANKHIKTADNKKIRRRSFSMRELDKIVSSQILPNNIDRTAKFASDVHKLDNFKLTSFASRLSGQFRQQFSEDIIAGRDPSKLRKFDIDTHTMRTITANATLGAFQFQKTYALPYMRKSLSLNYQTVDVLKKISTGIGSLEKNLLIKLEAIKMNTGAPDATKTLGYFPEIRLRMRANLINRIADNHSTFQTGFYDKLYKKYADPVAQHIKSIFDNPNGRRSGINGVFNAAGNQVNTLRRKARSMIDPNDNESVGSKIRNTFGKASSAALSPVVKIMQRSPIPSGINKLGSGMLKSYVDMFSSVQPFEDPNARLHGGDDNQSGITKPDVMGVISKIHRTYLKRSKTMIDHLEAIRYNTEKCCTDKSDDRMFSPTSNRGSSGRTSTRSKSSSKETEYQTNLGPVTNNSSNTKSFLNNVKNMSSRRKKNEAGTALSSTNDMITPVSNNHGSTNRKVSSKSSIGELRSLLNVPANVEKELERIRQQDGSKDTGPGSIELLRKVLENTESEANKDRDLIHDLINPKRTKGKKNSLVTSIGAAIASALPKSKPVKSVDPERGHLANLKPGTNIPKGGRSDPINKHQNDGGSEGGGTLNRIASMLGLGLEGEGLVGGVLGSLHRKGITGAISRQLDKTLLGRVGKGTVKLAGKAALGTTKFAAKGAFKGTKLLATKGVPMALKVTKGLLGATWKGTKAAGGFVGRNVLGMGGGPKTSFLSKAGGLLKSPTLAAAGVGIGGYLANNYFEKNTTGWTKRLGTTAASAAQYGALGFSVGGPWGAAIGAAVGGVIANADVVSKGLHYVGRGIGAVVGGVSSINKDLRYMMFGPVGMAYGMMQKGSTTRSLLDNVKTSLFGKDAVYDKKGNIVKPSEGGIMSSVGEGFSKFFFGSKDGAGNFKPGSSILSQIGDTLSKTASGIKDRIVNAASTVATTAGQMGSGAISGAASGYAVGGLPGAAIGAAAGAFSGGVGQKAVGSVLDRAKQVFNILTTKLGWSAAAATGIIANMKHESNINPHGPAGDSGLAIGIGQWHPDRQANIRNRFGKSIQEMSLEEQVRAYDWELRGGDKTAAKKALPILLKTNDPGEAAAAVALHFERMKDTVGQTRGRAATARSLASQLQGQSNSDSSGKESQSKSAMTNSSGSATSGSMLMKPKTPGFKPMSSVGGFSSSDSNKTPSNDNKTSTDNLSNTRRSSEKSSKPTKSPVISNAFDMFNQAANMKLPSATKAAPIATSPAEVPTAYSAPKASPPPAPMAKDVSAYQAPTRAKPNTEQPVSNVSELVEHLSANVVALRENTQALLSGSKMAATQPQQSPITPKDKGSQGNAVIMAPVVNNQTPVHQAVNDAVMSMKKLLVQTG